MRSWTDSSIDSPESTIVEQRLFLRKRVPIPLPIQLFPGKEVWLDDVGEGGLSVSGTSKLELGTTTFLTFEFPNANATIEAVGVVAWCDPGGRAGVRFTRIKPDSSAALKRWLKAPAKSDPRLPTKSPEAEIVAVPTGPSLQAEMNRATSSPAPSLGCHLALELIAQRMLRQTRATGAAVAWKHSDDIICQASTGSAPPIGAVLDLHSSLTGECYRSGRIVSVADAEDDSRIDVGVRSILDFRSLLIVPIRRGDEVIGIAEVFSTLPGNFDGGDILFLGSVVELIADLYVRNLQSAPRPTSRANACCTLPSN